MQVKVSHPTKTEAVITVIAADNELQAIKLSVIEQFQNKVKVPGFREGKTPANILEKNISPNVLQTDFLEAAIEQLYTQALQSQKLKPVDRPEISIKKFVPYSVLEFEAKTPVISEVKLAVYKKIKLPRKTVEITAKDVTEVIDSLLLRAATKTEVQHAAKSGDEAVIDFKGVDAKGKAINGADGKDYPLLLGSNVFIPGFEDNLLGLKPGEDKTFTLTFPKDYNVDALANKKVTFSVTVKKVLELTKPKPDDDFAPTVGPFKTVAELKTDIKKQLSIEKQRELDRAYENELIQKISAGSEIEIPEALILDQIERIENEEKQNLIYRGQTWQEHLEDEGVTAEEHKTQKRPNAIERLKASLVLAEIAEIEKLEVTPEELEMRMQILKSQYQDPKMQEELDKPEARRDIAGRILTEKTLERIVSYSSKK